MDKSQILKLVIFACFMTFIVAIGVTIYAANNPNYSGGLSVMDVKND